MDILILICANIIGSTIGANLGLFIGYRIIKKRIEEEEEKKFLFEAE